jgi:hypothetical protein
MVERYFNPLQLVGSGFLIFGIFFKNIEQKPQKNRYFFQVFKTLSKIRYSGSSKRPIEVKYGSFERSQLPL